jgi:hypothetical protein
LHLQQPSARSHAPGSTLLREGVGEALKPVQRERQAISSVAVTSGGATTAGASAMATVKRLANRSRNGSLSPNGYGPKAPMKKPVKSAANIPASPVVCQRPIIVARTRRFPHVRQERPGFRHGPRSYDVSLSERGLHLALESRLAERNGLGRFGGDASRRVVDDGVRIFASSAGRTLRPGYSLHRGRAGANRRCTEHAVWGALLQALVDPGLTDNWHNMIG